MRTKLLLSAPESIKKTFIRVLLKSLLILALCPVPCALRPALAQVPQGFNYQAIARDGSGNPIIGATIMVRLSILSDTNGFRPGGGGVYVWEEEHLNVMTNGYGLFNIVLGDTSASIIVGTSFNAIDWNQSKLFIGTKIANPTNYKVLGGAKLWSVPYSLVAGELGGTVDKIKVKGTEAEPDSALFEVRNKNGQIVFAVYNEGVRVYVDDGVKGNTKGGFAIGGFGTDKGTSQNYLMVSRDSIRAYVNDTIAKGVTKGGFAIGGFGTAKGKQEYLRVTRDSTRIYVNDTGTKGNTKGGFAIGGFGTFKGDGNSFFNVLPDSTGKVVPAQNKILWYPLKNAFQAGKVLIENRDSVGENSFASGYQPRAKGKFSQAMGFMPVARGNFSTAIGKNSLASGANSFAFGDNPKAQAADSYAFGAGSIASGIGSFSFGSVGRDTLAVTTGIYTSAIGNYSFAMGQGSKAIGIGSVVLGVNSVSQGDYSTALGNASTAFGPKSAALGYLVTASGLFSTAIGSPSYKMTFNPNTEYSAMTVASGVASIALGHGVTSKSYASIALGQQNFDPIGSSPTVWVPTDPLFMLGNGNGPAGSSTAKTANAVMILKNGNVGLGFNTPAYKLDVNGEITSRNPLSGISFRLRNQYYSTMLYHDDNDFYFLLTNLNDPDGIWNNYRPFKINYSTGNVYLGCNNSGSSYTMAVTSDGNVGIGYSTPASAFHVQKNINGHLIYMKNSYNGATGHGIALFAGQNGVNSGAELMTFFSPDGATLGYIKQNGANSVQYLSASDIRLKENIVKTTYSIDDLMKVTVRDYNLISDINKEKVTGFVAQELYEVFPDAVNKPTDEQGIWGVEYGKITPLIVKGVQDQQNMIIQLREENLLLKNELQSLKGEVEQIKALLMKGGVR